MAYVLIENNLRSLSQSSGKSFTNRILKGKPNRIVISPIKTIYTTHHVDLEKEANVEIY
jgi:hypothetical protein